jgi:hypothetical protein
MPPLRGLESATQNTQQIPPMQNTQQIQPTQNTISFRLPPFLETMKGTTVSREAAL